MTETRTTRASRTTTHGTAARSARRRLAGVLVAGALLTTLEAVVCATPAPAAQLDFSCSDAALILGDGDERLQFSLVGETVGAAATIGNLLCFVNDRRCACVRNATDGDRSESTSFSREVGRIIASCFNANPGRPLSGISQEAVLNVCR
jgi:hypothetical protein